MNAITWIGIVLTAFLLRLVFHWKPEWMLKCTHVKSSLAKAQKVLLVDQYKQMFVETVTLLTSNTPGNDAIVNVDVNVKANGQAPVSRDVKEQKLLWPGPQGKLQEVDSIQFFENKKIKYLWDSKTKEYVKLRGLELVPCSYFYQQRGLLVSEQCQRNVLYGNNLISVPVQSVMKLLLLEILNPFYVFQIFSVCLWYSDQYAYYATCIVIMSAFSITTTVLQIRKNEKALRKTIQTNDVVEVWRGSDVYETISSDQLVPGDVIVIPSHGCVMHCDAVLVSGNCIVNESMLTGESVPVTKTPIPKASSQRAGRDPMYHYKEHAKHTLFCGTKVIQTRYYGSEKVKAVVIRTGFMTAKGELVRSIMFPKPVDFKFHRDSLKFIGLLFLTAFVGFVYTVVRMVMEGASASQIMLDALDLITIAVPPALPAAMTVGIAYAQSRLKKNDIYCISPRSINISGCLNCICFDKTGTLTEDGLDMWGVLPADEKGFGPVVGQIDTLPVGSFLIGMATCHSLTIIDGQLSGDPLDLKMFESTTWLLEEPEIEETTKYDMITPTIVKPVSNSQILSVKNDKEHRPAVNGSVPSELQPPFEVGIVRQFPFSSSLQRMSVVTRVLGAKHFEIYTKGSPEVISMLSAPETVPPNFTDVLMQYTCHGYRVLALASKPLPKMTYAKVQRILREDVESNLVFLGLLVMENRLKPETNPIIKKLKKANIRTVMVTGDNMLTALSVARDCGMIEKNHKVILVNVVKAPEERIPAVQFIYAEMADKEVVELEYSSPDKTEVVVEQHGDRFHFAVTGKAYAVIKEYFPDLMPKLAVRGTVFARMSPDQKQQLVEQLQDLGYYVGMCGDGANDCGALKTAHAGVSLSEAEASVASPFTSKKANISCVPDLMREGRAAMTTSFGIFKYMACYSLTQFASVLILYSINSNLSDFEFLYIDLFLITLFAALFGRTEAYHDLVKTPPPSSLIGFAPLASIVIQMSVIIAVQVFAFFFVQTQPWFTPFHVTEESEVSSYENYSVFSISSFQYITLVICFAKGAPYRKSIFSNHVLLGVLLFMTAFTVYLVIYPCSWLVTLLELKLPPFTAYRCLMVGVAAVNFVICVILEFLLGMLVVRLKKNYSTFQTFSQYMQVEQDIVSSPEWPPVTADVEVADLPLYSSSVSSPTPQSALDVAEDSSDDESDIHEEDSVADHQVTYVIDDKKVAVDMGQEDDVVPQNGPKGNSGQSGGSGPGHGTASESDWVELNVYPESLQTSAKTTGNGVGRDLKLDADDRGNIPSYHEFPVSPGTDTDGERTPRRDTSQHSVAGFDQGDQCLIERM